MSASKDPEVILRGCKRTSKIFPIALELADLYRQGKSPLWLINHFAKQGHKITTGMISGYVHRNKLQRNHVTPVEKSKIEVEKVKQANLVKEQNDQEAQAAQELTLKKIAEANHARALALIAYRKQHAEAMARNAEMNLTVVVDNTPGKKLLSMGRCQCWFHVGQTPATPADQLFCGTKTSGGMFCDAHDEIAYDRRSKEQRRIRA